MISKTTLGSLRRLKYKTVADPCWLKKKKKTEGNEVSKKKKNQESIFTETS